MSKEFNDLKSLWSCRNERGVKKYTKTEYIPYLKVQRYYVKLNNSEYRWLRWYQPISNILWKKCLGGGRQVSRVGDSMEWRQEGEGYIICNFVAWVYKQHMITILLSEYNATFPCCLFCSMLSLWMCNLSPT